MKVNIKEQEIQLKYSFRALIMYEEIIGETFQPKSTKNIITFIYCIILSSCKDITFTFEDFMDWLDDNPHVLNEFNDWLVEELKMQEVTKKKKTKSKERK